MQSGPMACLARQVPCSQPGLLDNCQRAEWSVESKGPPLGWADDSVCGRASWELGPCAGSCRNSGSTRSSLRRRPLWSWAPLHCTRFSSSTRPGGGHTGLLPLLTRGHQARGVTASARGSRPSRSHRMLRATRQGKRDYPRLTGVQPRLRGVSGRPVPRGGAEPGCPLEAAPRAPAPVPSVGDTAL